MHPVKLYLVRVFSVFDILYKAGQPHFLRCILHIAAHAYASYTLHLTHYILHCILHIASYTLQIMH